MNTLELDKAACWCGGTLRKGVHEDYPQCELCQTQHYSHSVKADTLESFYSLQGYWHDNMSRVNQPPIEQRAEGDFKDRIPWWLEKVKIVQPQAKTVFEIGAAHGGFLRHCKENGFQHAHGCEPDPKTCAYALERFKIALTPGLFPKISVAGLLHGGYDCVCMFDVMEHAIDPVEFVNGAKFLLRSDGCLYIQTPEYRNEGKDWQQYRAGEHLWLFTRRGMRDLLQTLGFDFVHISAGLFPNDMFVVARL